MFRYYYCYWWTDWPNTQLYTELTSELIGRETSAEESGHFQEVLSVFPMKMKTLWVSKFINEALLLLWNQYFLDLGQFYPKARWKCICVIRYSSLKSLSFSASIEQSCSVIFFFFNWLFGLSLPGCRETFGIASRVPSTVSHFKTEPGTSFETL